MVADGELSTALASSLATPVRICARRPSPYASSFPLEHLELETGDRRRLELVWKDISPDALLPGGRRARGGCPSDPSREPRAYELLEGAGLGTPRRYAALAGSWRAWLFLEAVQGTRLDEIGALETWQEVARWLARAHTTLAGRSRGLAWPPPWRKPDLDAAIARVQGPRGRRIAALATPLAVAWARAATSPPAVIHGELYPANVLVAGERVCVLDWETIARGPALLDLAALTAGRWDEPGEPLAEAYRTALPDPPAPDALRAELDACRLLVATGWLAAPADWTPPRAQARDWLVDAELIAGRMQA
jgi:hypothetical protein